MKKPILQMLVGTLFFVVGASAFAANHAVRVGPGTVFTPSNLTIARGDTVVFTNAGGTHNVVSDNSLFRCAIGCDGQGGNGNLSATAWSAAVTFNDAGTFGYFCEAHGSAGSGMAGRVVVQGGAPAFVIGPAISGNWFDPLQNGHGFQFEVVNATTMSAFWFTFDNAGNAAWFSGVGTIQENRVVMEARRVTGGRFPPNFNPAVIQAPVWGTLTFTFTGCNSGKVDWVATDPAFTATGTMNLTRGTQIAGTVCQ